MIMNLHCYIFLSALLSFKGMEKICKVRAFAGSICPKGTFSHDKVYINCTDIGLDKSGYQVNIFLISPRKHTLWVLGCFLL